MSNRISVKDGRSETIRCDGPAAERPDGVQLETTRTTNRSLRSTIPPAREPTGGANEDVSWLRAIQLAFPGYPSGIEPITSLPVTVAGGRRRCSRLPPPPPRNKSSGKGTARRGPAATPPPPTPPPRPQR